MLLRSASLSDSVAHRVNPHTEEHRSSVAGTDVSGSWFHRSKPRTTLFSGTDEAGRG